MIPGVFGQDYEASDLTHWNWRHIVKFGIRDASIIDHSTIIAPPRYQVFESEHDMQIDFESEHDMQIER